MWACGETNRTGEFQRCKCILFEVHNSVFYSFVQDFPAIDSLNTAFSESLRQEQSTGEQFRLTPHTRVGTLIVATIYLQLIQNRYMFRSFTVLQCSHQHCVQPVASDVEVVGYL